MITVYLKKVKKKKLKIHLVYKYTSGLTFTHRSFSENPDSVNF